MTMRAAGISAAGRVFYAGTQATSLAIGLLQMFHVRGGFITSYGADVFGTAWLYAMFRQGTTVLQRGRVFAPEAAAGLVFLGCAASEYGQRLHLVPGTFDPCDLLAFGVTVLVCCGIDRRIVALA
jgi:hypothetical protein